MVKKCGKCKKVRSEDLNMKEAIRYRHLNFCECSGEKLYMEEEPINRNTYHDSDLDCESSLMIDYVTTREDLRN